MAFDHSFIDEIKNKIDIVNVIGKDVKLKRKGGNYWGNCPFHSEKTPSFSVNEEGQFYHCFGCGAGGDVIKFTQEYYKLDFNEAITKLCTENGIEIPKMSKRNRVDYNRYYDINVMTARFYLEKLRELPNQGYDYIHGRGLSNKILNNFGIGYAPNGWSELYEHLKAKEVRDEEMLKLGLVKRGKNGALYDKFRNRVIFPIINTRGNVIGFGGRSLEKEDKSVPKYLNSDESDIFLKKNNLYGLNFASKAIRQEGNVIVVEGYMDVISLHQAGIKNVIASLGTALTEEQARLISRYTKNVVLSYDSDRAGINASLRGIDVLRTANLNIKVLSIENGKDPDEFVKHYGADEFRKLVKKSIPGIDFKLNVLSNNYDLSNDIDLLAYMKESISVLSSLSPVEQDLYIRKLSSKLKISEQAIRSEVNTISDSTINAQRTMSVRRRNNNRKNADADLRIELHLLLLSSTDIDYLDVFHEDGIVFRTYLGKKIFHIENELAEREELRGNSLDINKIFERLDPEEEIAFRKSIDKVFIGGNTEEFYKECLSKYKMELYAEQKNQMQNELEVAEKMNDKDAIEAAAVSLLQINSAIRDLKGE